jgi:hypothetical protein
VQSPETSSIKLFNLDYEYLGVVCLSMSAIKYIREGTPSFTCVKFTVGLALGLLFTNSLVNFLRSFLKQGPML